MADDWLVNAFSLMEANPDAGIICGRGEAVFETEAPIWFKRYQANYAVGPQYPENGTVSESQKFLYDAGSVLRKTSIQGVINSGFTPMLESRSKNKLLSGDNTEIQVILRLTGWKVQYNDSLRFKHFMPASRLNWQYFLALKRALGASKVYLDLYEPLLQGNQYDSSKKGRANLMTKLLLDLLALFTLGLHRYEGNYRTAKASALLGEFLEKLRIRRQQHQIHQRFNENLEAIFNLDKSSQF